MLLSGHKILKWQPPTFLHLTLCGLLGWVKKKWHLKTYSWRVLAGALFVLNNRPQAKWNWWPTRHVVATGEASRSYCEHVRINSIGAGEMALKITACSSRDSGSDPSNHAGEGPAVCRTPKDLILLVSMNTYVHMHILHPLLFKNNK